ncbi:hypothetical protein KY290_037314 [Solanum tuberosum]|uniref:DUF659 domain-containing protein n=1 Tax=Solanum tuberosum TaxID=4113 RepID=A0ABQ7TV60_SOLTU|nr:hypothetical protein KY285_036610 [Solanum tuberosum]KAH0738609.1 hypothetical protein KY290_037314 [Solanum tuberosum]
MANGLFGCGPAKRARVTRSPVEWWSLFDSETPNLQKFVIKRNRLALSRLNDLVYIKYNRTLKRHYDARDLVDPIRLDNIDDSNEWLVGCPEDQEDELVYEDDYLTWGSVATAIGANESIYHLRGLSSRSRALDKGKGVETSSTCSTSSRTRTLIDEDYEEEEDEEQYNDVEDAISSPLASPRGEAGPCRLLSPLAVQNTAIERIGPENGVQIVTDNASENVKAGSMMMGAYPHIYWTPCAAHCINLMFGDIFKVKPYASVFKKAIRIHSYISQRPLLLNLMRKFTKERNLVKLAKTRFATAFLTLRAMYIQRKNLRTLVLSTEWTSSKFAKETFGKDVANLIISAHFWDDVVRALTVCGPLTKVLRLVDGEKKPPMGYIYEAMDRAKETIERGFRGIKKQYEKVFGIIYTRWSDQIHRPLHAAGHVLNPGLYYKAQEEGTLLQSLWTEYYACVEKMIPDTTIQDLLVAELPRYKMANGLFGCGPAKRARDTRSPGKFISKRGIGFALSRLNDLVYIKYNRTLKHRYDARDLIDPIRLDNIDDSNEWLVGCPEDQEDELVYEDDYLTWGSVATAIGADENIYHLRGLSSRSGALDKGKGVETSSISSTSSRTRTLIDEDYEEEEDEEQYNDVEDVDLQELDSFEE